MVFELVFLGLGGYLGAYAAQKLGGSLAEVPGPVTIALAVKDFFVRSDSPSEVDPNVDDKEDKKGARGDARQRRRRRR